MADQNGQNGDGPPHIPPGTLVPQEHGGALLHGNPGNRGGPGTPPSRIRERLRGSFERRIRVLEQFADGEATEKIKLKLRDVADHLTCPSCQHELEIKEGSAEVTITVNVSAQAKERLTAIDLMGKYSIGSQRTTIHIDAVTDILTAQIDLLQRELPPKEAKRIIDLLEPLWS